MIKIVKISFLSLLSLAGVLAADLTIQIDGTQPVSRKTARYQCDANAGKLGLPAGAFSVEYINGGGNSLAVLPISGRPLIFAGVSSASGARYAAQQYIWWEAAGRSITLRSDSLDGGVETACTRAQ